jgi:hypothetical protein
MDGDEMTRIIWHKIREQPFLSTDEFMDAIDAQLKRRMS